MDREALVKQGAVRNRRGENKKNAMHIQFIWEQFMLIKWLIKKKPSALCKLKEKRKRTAIQMEDERRELSRRRDGMTEEDGLSDKNMVR